MKYTKLGNSDLNVSRVCMGCMGFGDAAHGQHTWTLDETHSREIIKHGLELGINFFDTAIAYQSGTSEQYLGRALKDFARRDDVVVATKFLPRTPEEIVAGVTGQQHIETMLNKSLENLGMDHVDLYIYHMWDHQTPIYDILDGLNRMVKAGKARYIGISNCFAWQLCKANALAEREGFAKFVSVQSHYNLIFREEEREMAPFCREENIAMTPYSALAGGRLSKRPGETSQRLEQDLYAKGKYDAAAQQDGEVIRRVAELCRVLSDLKNAGHEIILVSSGAIAMGVGKLSMTSRPHDTPTKQAAASIGQCELMYLYDKHFTEYHHKLGQILLTREDIDHAWRKANIVNTFESLLGMGAIPIVNENDTVATEEISVGDNDTLSAVVAGLTHADALVILSDIDGLFTANPATNPDARLIPRVTEIDDALRGIAEGAGSLRGTGGMATKISAAGICFENDCTMAIINGAYPERIYDLLEGRSVGTLFQKEESK